MKECKHKFEDVGLNSMLCKKCKKTFSEVLEKEYEEKHLSILQLEKDKKVKKIIITLVSEDGKKSVDVYPETIYRINAHHFDAFDIIYELLLKNM